MVPFHLAFRALSQLLACKVKSPGDPAATLVILACIDQMTLLEAGGRKLPDRGVLPTVLHTSTTSLEAGEARKAQLDSWWQ